MQANRRYQRLLVFTALVASGSCFAQVNKCITADGKIEFTSKLCASNAAGERVRAVPNSVDSSGAREQALKAENQRLREQLNEQSVSPQGAQSSQNGRTYADLQAEKASSYDCEIAQKNYATTASISGKYKRDATPERLKMCSACGMREPDVTNIIVKPDRHAAPVPPPSVITRCDGAWCYDSNGRVIPRVGR